MTKKQVIKAQIKGYRSDKFLSKSTKKVVIQKLKNQLKKLK